MFKVFTNGHIDKFNENENKNAIAMSFKVNDKQLFKNCNKIWEKVERLMIIELTANLLMVINT